MEFARKQLEKYGWTDGKGLGKKEDGISEALKPKLKRSITGVGYDAAKDFTEHWWSELYNKAASNVQVEDNEGKTKRIKRKDDNFEITNNTYLLKHKKKSKNATSDEEYKDFFVRTEVFENDGAKIVKVQESESSDESDGVVQMTDEQLFAACNGRTAHKGARHGLRALGKLARIEQQEQILLQESRFKGYSQAKKIKNKTHDNQVVEDMLINSDQEENMLKLKKKKKKHCSSFNESINNDYDLGVQENENVATIEKDVIKKSKKRKKEKLNNDDVKSDSIDVNIEINDNDNNVNNEIESDNDTKNKKKKKIKNDVNIKNKEDEIVLDEICTSDVKIKSKKKRKCNSDAIDEIKVKIELDDVIAEKISKKVKKKIKSID